MDDNAFFERAILASAAGPDDDDAIRQLRDLFSPEEMAAWQASRSAAVPVVVPVGHDDEGDRYWAEWGEFGIRGSSPTSYEAALDDLAVHVRAWADDARDVAARRGQTAAVGQLVEELGALGDEELRTYLLVRVSFDRGRLTFGIADFVEEDGTTTQRAVPLDEGRPPAEMDLPVDGTRKTYQSSVRGDRVAFSPVGGGPSIHATRRQEDPTGVVHRGWDDDWDREPGRGEQDAEREDEPGDPGDRSGRTPAAPHVAVERLTAVATLQGPRIRLEPLGPEHFDDVWGGLADAETLRLTGTRTRFTEAAVAAHLARIGADPSRADWAILDASTGHYLGEIVLNELDEDNASMNIRIALLPGMPGNGYGTEAMTVALDHAFAEIGLHRVQLDVYAFNPRAVRSYEKAGFVAEGRQRDTLYWDGEWTDSILMSVLASDRRPTLRRK